MFLKLFLWVRGRRPDTLLYNNWTSEVHLREDWSLSIRNLLVLVVPVWNGSCPLTQTRLLKWRWSPPRRLWLDVSGHAHCWCSLMRRTAAHDRCFPSITIKQTKNNTKALPPILIHCEQNHICVESKLSVIKETLPFLLVLYFLSVQNRCNVLADPQLQSSENSKTLQQCCLKRTIKLAIDLYPVLQ